tara:strand:- start:1318 stop:1893 length:576 start_codon:yes stop_codon:yes gene_type:complete
MVRSDILAEFPEHPFWDFSLSVYMSEGVGAACLDLQEAHELDVNVLLFCIWLGASGRGSLSPAEMKTVTGAVREWHHEVVRELRAVRVRMKGGMPPAPAGLSESLRQRIQKTEIDCEHTEQLMLAAAIDREPDDSRAGDLRLADAVANIAIYFAGFGAAATDADRSNVAHMLAVAFSGHDADAVRQACAKL